MEIKIHFERKDPDNELSDVIYRALDIKTTLGRDTIDSLARDFCTPMISSYNVISDECGIRTLRIGVGDAAWSSFSRFLYEIINHERGR